MISNRFMSCRTASRASASSTIEPVTCHASFLSQPQGGRMLRLIQANLPSTGQFHLRNRAPSRFLNLGALHTLLAECIHFRFQAVAHKIEFMRTVLTGRVECGGSAKINQPWPASTDLNP